MPSKPNAWPSRPVAVVLAPPFKTASLVLARSLVAPSPLHQPISPGGGATHAARAVKPPANRPANSHAHARQALCRRQMGMAMAQWETEKLMSGFSPEHSHRTNPNSQQ